MKTRGKARWKYCTSAQSCLKREKMNFESASRLKIIRSIAVPLGLWPYGCTILGKINGAIALAVIVLFVVAQLAVFITNEFSVDLLFKCVIGMVPCIVYILKYFISMWKMDQVKYAFDWIQCDYDSLTNEREFRLLEKSANQGTIIAKFFFYSVLLVIVPMGLPFLLVLFNIETPGNQSRSVMFPFEVEYFVDQDRYFYWIMFHIDATTVLGVSIVFVAESTFLHFTVHACGLLQIVGDRVEQMVESSILSVLSGKTYLAIHGQLVATIQLHQRALNFIEFLNTTFLPHYCILLVVAVASLAIHLCTLAKSLLLMKVTGEVLIACVLVIVNFSYMGCGNYIGQILLDNGNELFTKTYCSRWYEAPRPVQKMMLYIRQRSMQPTEFVFGGLYPSSIENYSKLVNTSMSYFMVLYSTI